MNLRSTRLLALLVALLLAAAAAGAVPTYGAGPTARKASVQVSKRVVVKWNAATQKHPKFQKTADVPGIGAVDLVCQPDNTMIRLHADNRRAESQMWLAKFETKDGTDRVAVKNVRIYTYATAADDGTGGTGPKAHEGLNQKSPIEDFEKGSAYGLISQRPGRNQDGGGALSTPATAFKLTWYWERFAYPGSQYCKMTLALKTDTDRQFGLSWHGNDEAATASTSSTSIPGLGDALLTCETGRDGDQSVALRPPAYDAGADPDGSGEPFMDYEYVQGEGLTTNHVEHFDDLVVDPVTGLVGPVDLPHNGMMRLWFAPYGDDGPKIPYVLTSYLVTNNAAKPGLNLCEVAAAPLP